ncbi:MAG: glycosyltransferase family 2 protein [Candidatus Omnitrophota bacterium]
MKCDIVIPVWNKKQLTKRCVDHILSNTIFPYTVLLIDNASKDDTRKYLEKTASDNPDRIKLIVNKENLGNTTAGVQGMTYGDAEYVCILDNDTIVCKDWLVEMVKVAEASDDIGIVNPSSNTFGLRKKKMESLEDFTGRLVRENSGKFVEIGTAVGFCYLVKRKLINEIGVWDERFSPGYFEDTEYSMRAKQKGYKSVMALGSYVYHEEHASFKGREKKEHFEKLFNESKEKFYKLYRKPKRMLYVIKDAKNEGFQMIKENMYSFADAGNWIDVMMKKSDIEEIKDLNHGNIRKIFYEDSFFNVFLMFKVLTKKKKYDSINVNSKSLLGRFEMFKKIHKAELKLLEK